MPSASRSGAAASLVARVRPIWPTPIDLRVSRWSPTRGTTGQDYLVLPSLRRPVFLVPARSPAASGAIVRFDDGQRASIPLRVLAWAQAKGLLRLMPVVRLSVSDQSSSLLKVVAAAVPEADAIVVRLGRPRYGRAVILIALDAAGRSIAFAKCAWGQRISDLAQERDNLTSIAEAPIPGIRAPQVLAFEEDAGFAALVLEALTPRSPASGATEVPVDAMKVLAARHGWRPTTLRRSDVILRLGDGIARIQDSQQRAWLQAELDRLVDELGDVETATGSWHGDWVPWNMARDADIVLLWDWEHGQDGMLPGADHLHYLAQELRLRVGTTSNVEDSWLVAARTALASNWGVRGPEADAAIRTYLLVVNLRYVTDREGAPEGGSPRSGWSRQLLERLGGA